MPGGGGGISKYGGGGGNSFPIVEDVSSFSTGGESFEFTGKDEFKFASDKASTVHFWLSAAD